AGLLEVARALPQHGQRLVHPDHDAGGLAAREPLHLDLDAPHVDVVEVHVDVAQVGGGAAEAVAAGGQLGQGARDVDEVLVGVPARAHALDVELEDGGRETAAVEDGHARPGLYEGAERGRRGSWTARPRRFVAARRVWST